MMVDTGVLVAAADRSERRHRDAVAVLTAGGEKVVTDAILSETHHLIAARVGFKIAAAFLGSIDRDLVVESSVASDRARAREICVTHIDARIDYTDALTIAIAERIGEAVIATMDERHFRLIRPRHITAFEIIPG